MSELERGDHSAELERNRLGQVTALIITHKVLREGVEVVDGEPVFMDDVQLALVNAVDTELVALEPNPDKRVALIEKVDNALRDKDLVSEEGYGGMIYQTALDTIDAFVENNKQLQNQKLDLSRIRKSIQARRDKLPEESLDTALPTRRRLLPRAEKILSRSLLTTIVLAGGITVFEGVEVAADTIVKNNQPVYAKPEGRDLIKSELQIVGTDLKDTVLPLSASERIASISDAYDTLLQVQLDLAGSGPRFENRVSHILSTLQPMNRKASFVTQGRELGQLEGQMGELSNMPAAQTYKNAVTNMKKEDHFALVTGTLTVGASLFEIKRRRKSRRKMPRRR